LLDPYLSPQNLMDPILNHFRFSHFMSPRSILCHVRWALLITAWRLLRLRMEKTSSRCGG
jgi:hypothetical protein